MVRMNVTSLMIMGPAFCLSAAGGRANAALEALRLRCEYSENPLAIDTPHPRLSWQLQSAERGQRQTAYQVLVASSADQLKPGAADLWDSGKVPSDQSIYVPYAGKPLASRQRCYWTVRIWDRDGSVSDWSQPAFFGTGLLRGEDWQGQWIASDLELMGYQKELRALPDFGMEPETEIWALAPKLRQMGNAVQEAPAVWLRKEFALEGAPRRATAYVCGLGLFELYLNGKRIGDHQLDPAYTDYAQRVFYVAHDVTDAVRSGKNAVGVVLGNGWFNLITPHVLRFYAADYIAPPQLRLELEVEFADGSRRIIPSDTTWRATTDGPIRFNCVLAGETYDARREMPGWSEPSFDDSAWQPARVAPAPAGQLLAQQLAPVRKIRAIPATRVEKLAGGWRFDFGVETTGWARIRVRGRPGQQITVRYPGADSHTLGRYQTCQYICKGGGVETYAPRFCYNGFRYADVTGLDEQPALDDAVAEVVCTDLPVAGEFACSDERLNRLQEILLRTVRNYMVHLPNDPTREKAGWTQDIETGFFQTAYNFASASTYVKWQRDFLDALHPNGYMPPVAPGRFDGPTINGPWWGGVVVYAPWYLYEFYGDTGILADSYPGMKRYFAWLGTRADHHIIHWGLGDWLEVGSPDARPKRTPVPLTSTCAYYWFARILGQTATLLGQADEAAQYNGIADEIRAAYNREFYKAETGDYAGGSQTAQLVSLLFDLVPQDQRELVLRRLVERIAEDKQHLSTGFVGTPLLLTGLVELGRPDLAWTIAVQTDYPSFIDAVLNRGNTVMKETWEGGQVQMPSLQGPIGTWFYHSLAGIRPDRSAPGFKKIIIRPETAGSLTWVRAHHDCPYGRIASAWKRDGAHFSLDVTIPPNTTATVYLPARALDGLTESGKPLAQVQEMKSVRMEGDRAVLEIGSGDYRFESSMP